MKIKLVILLIFFTSLKLIAAATLDGTWQGTGQLRIKGQSVTENCQMYLVITQSDIEFSVIKSDFKCPSMHIKNKEQNKLTINNHRLYFNNIERGYIDDSTMYSYFNTAAGLIQSYLMKYTDEEQSLVYSDSIDWNPTFSTQLNGRLRRINTP